MSHKMLNLNQAAELVHLSANELRHVAQRGEIKAARRGDDWFFDQCDLDEWAQRNILSQTERELKRRHREMMDENRRNRREGWGVSDLFRAEAVHLCLTAKAKAGILRDMTDLADKSGLVYNAEGLFRELENRENAASTAIGEGVALLHARFLDPYMFQETFVAYGRSERPIFFGAPNGEATRHFFLVCSTDHEQHLHILARLAILAHGTDLIERLEAVETVEDALAVVADCESPFRTHAAGNAS